MADNKPVSTDATIAHAVSDAQQGDRPNDAQQQRTGRTVGGALGGLLGGGDLGRVGGALGSLAGGLHIGGNKNVKSTTLDDGTPAKVALGNATSGPVGVVVTPNQTSVAFDKDHNGTLETIVTESQGTLTVGNVETHRSATVNNPSLSAALDKYQYNKMPKMNDTEFNSAAQTAAFAESLVPPPPPPAAPAAHAKPHGRSRN